MPTKRMWLGHAPDKPQIDQIEFDETSATIVAEGTDLIFEVNGKELLVENPHPLEDDDATEVGDTSGIITLLQAAEAAINGSQIPEIAELEASVESPDTDPESPYHRMFVTTREQFHGWPFSLTVKAPNPTIDIDYVQKGAPGQNEKQSYYITPTALGGSHRIKWNFGSGVETSGSIPFDGDAADVKAAMVVGMPTITEDNVIVTGSNTQADPFVIELTDDLAETSFGLLSVDVAELTGNGKVTISTLQDGGSSGGGSNLVNDTFTVGVDTLLSAHTGDTSHTWTVSGRDGKIFQVNDNIQFGRTDSPGSGTTLARSSLTGNADAEIEFTYSNVGVATSYQGILFRLSDTSNYLTAEFSFNAGTNGLSMRIRKVEGGSPTNLATKSVTIAAETVFALKLLASGSSLTFEVTPQGQTAQVLSTTSSFNQSATAHGLIATDSNDSLFGDNFKINSVSTLNEKWAIYTNGQGGSFTLTKPGGSPTNAISPGASTATLKSELEGIYGGTFTVTGSGVPASPWIAEAGGALAGTDQLEPEGDGTNLTGGFDAIVNEVQDGSPPLDTIWDVFIHNTTSGNFTFEFLGRPTANIAYGATGATVLTELQSLSPGDFSTGIWTVVDTGIGSADYRITCGGRYSGALLTLAAENKDLVGTELDIIHTTIQQPTGRNWIDNPANYRDIATGLTGLPETGDELFMQIGDEAHSMRFGSLAGVKLARLVKSQLFRGHIGLPEINTGGYAEYRDTHITLEFQAGSQSFENPNVLIGVEQGQGSGLVRIRTLAGDEVHIRVERTGGPVEEGRPSFCWDGQNANSTLQVIEGFVGVAVFAGIAANLAHVVQRGGLLRFGELTAIGSGGFDRTGGETFGRASIGGSPVVFGA